MTAQRLVKEVLPEKKFKMDKHAKMCGVTGFINLKNEPAQLSLLKAMTDAITHRGPDGEGHWIENNVGLGHRRLAIVDLSDAGAQPMVSADHRYILTFNGEIYNFKELRELGRLVIGFDQTVIQKWFSMH